MKTQSDGALSHGFVGTQSSGSEYMLHKIPFLFNQSNRCKLGCFFGEGQGGIINYIGFTTRR